MDSTNTNIDQQNSGMLQGWWQLGVYGDVGYAQISQQSMQEFEQLTCINLTNQTYLWEQSVSDVSALFTIRNLFRSIASVIKVPSPLTHSKTTSHPNWLLPKMSSKSKFLTFYKEINIPGKLGKCCLNSTYWVINCEFSVSQLWPLVATAAASATVWRSNLFISHKSKHTTNRSSDPVTIIFKIYMRDLDIFKSTKLSRCTI